MLTINLFISEMKHLTCLLYYNIPVFDAGLLELIVKFMTLRSIKGKCSNIETLKFGVSGVLLLTLPVYLISTGTFITSLVIVNPNISFPLSIRLWKIATIIVVGKRGVLN